MVTVIIPNYNHGAFLEKRIESVLQQTYKDIEIILMDDCSTDNSSEIIESYRGNRLVTRIEYNSANSGSTFRQWKKGIELARGQYIWIAESDDYCSPDFLEVLSGLLNKEPDASLAYCKSIRVDERDAYLDDLSFWYNDLSPTRWTNDFVNTGVNEIKNYLAIRNTIPNASAVVFRKDRAIQVDDAFLDYKLSGDWLFWIKMLQIGDIIYSAKTTNYYRTHQNTVRSQQENNMTAGKEKLTILNYLADNSIISKKEAGFLSRGINNRNGYISRVIAGTRYLRNRILDRN